MNNWLEFHFQNQIEGMADFAVPTSGPALLDHDGERQYTLSLDFNEHGESTGCIGVYTQTDETGLVCEGTFEDTPDGYRQAKELANRLRIHSA